MNKKFTRYNFSFPPKTDELLKQMKEETDLSYTVLVKQAIALLAEKKGFKNEN